jgi:hypothetical protein
VAGGLDGYLRIIQFKIFRGGRTVRSTGTALLRKRFRHCRQKTGDTAKTAFRREEFDFSALGKHISHDVGQGRGAPPKPGNQMDMDWQYPFLIKKENDE